MAVNPLDRFNKLPLHNTHTYSKLIRSTVSSKANARRLLDCIAELYPSFVVPTIKQTPDNLIEIQWNSLGIRVEVSELSYVCWGTSFPLYKPSEYSNLARDLFGFYPSVNTV